MTSELFVNEDCDILLTEDGEIVNLSEVYAEHWDLTGMQRKLEGFKQQLKIAEMQGNRARASIYRNEIREIEADIAEAKRKKQSAA